MENDGDMPRVRDWLFVIFVWPVMLVAAVIHGR